MLLPDNIYKRVPQFWLLIGLLFLFLALTGGSELAFLPAYLMFGLFIPQPWIQPFCGGFIVGYLIYDYIHYSTHHFPMRNRLAKYLKHYHLKHHYSGEGGRYGVSSPVWDWVFGTDPGRG